MERHDKNNAAATAYQSKKKIGNVNNDENINDDFCSL